MTTHITKTWFDGEKVVTQEIPESEIYKQEQEPVAWQQELGNILCLIHRDGGQYISEHGWRKAIDDATLKIAKLNAASDNQKPVAFKWKGELFTPGEIEMLDVDDAVPLYEHPRQWVGLTNDELEEVFPAIAAYHPANKTLYRSIARAIEAELKGKNSG